MGNPNQLRFSEHRFPQSRVVVLEEQLRRVGSLLAEISGLWCLLSSDRADSPDSEQSHSGFLPSLGSGRRADRGTQDFSWFNRGRESAPDEEPLVGVIQGHWIVCEQT